MFSNNYFGFGKPQRPHRPLRLYLQKNFNPYGAGNQGVTEKGYRWISNRVNFLTEYMKFSSKAEAAMYKGDYDPGADYNTEFGTFGSSYVNPATVNDEKPESRWGKIHPDAHDCFGIYHAHGGTGGEAFWGENQGIRYENISFSDAATVFDHIDEERGGPYDSVDWDGDGHPDGNLNEAMPVWAYDTNYNYVDNDGDNDVDQYDVKYCRVLPGAVDYSAIWDEAKGFVGGLDKTYYQIAMENGRTQSVGSGGTGIFTLHRKHWDWTEGNEVWIDGNFQYSNSNFDPEKAFHLATLMLESRRRAYLAMTELFGSVATKRDLNYDKNRIAVFDDWANGWKGQEGGSLNSGILAMFLYFQHSISNHLLHFFKDDHDYATSYQDVIRIGAFREWFKWQIDEYKKGLANLNIHDEDDSLISDYKNKINGQEWKEAFNKLASINSKEESTNNQYKDHSGLLSGKLGLAKYKIEEVLSKIDGNDEWTDDEIAALQDLDDTFWEDLNTEQGSVDQNHTDVENFQHELFYESDYSNQPMGEWAPGHGSGFDETGGNFISNVDWDTVSWNGSYWGGDAYDGEHHNFSIRQQVNHINPLSSRHIKDKWLSLNYYITNNENNQHPHKLQWWNGTELVLVQNLPNHNEQLVYDNVWFTHAYAGFQDLYAKAIGADAGVHLINSWKRAEYRRKYDEYKRELQKYYDKKIDEKRYAAKLEAKRIGNKKELQGRIEQRRKVRKAQEARINRKRASQGISAKQKQAAKKKTLSKKR